MPLSRYGEELESRYKGTTILSFSVTLSADSCYAAILRFVLVVVVMVKVVVLHYVLLHTSTTTTNANCRIAA